jgi:hypothetical protein
MKRTFLLTALLMLLCVSASAYDLTDGKLYYNKLTSSTLEVTAGPKAYSGAMTIFGDVTIDNVQYTVTTIGAKAFCNNKGLSKVAIGQNITAIGDSAFAGCSGLTELFDLAMTAPTATATSFAGITSTCAVKVPNGYKGEYDTETGWVDFATNNKMTDYQLIPFDYGGFFYRVLSGSKKTVRVDFIDGFTFSGDIVIPSTIKYMTKTFTVTAINMGSFYNNTGLTSVTFPNTLTDIGYRSFARCNGLKAINIPGSVTNIDISAFEQCENIAKFTVDTTNTTYSSNDGMLLNAKGNMIVSYPIGGPTEFTVPNYITSFGEGSFYCCDKLTKLTVPNTVTWIGDRALYGCTALQSITFPEKLTAIGGYVCFNDSAMTSATIGPNVKSIGNYAFFGTKLNKLKCYNDSTATLGTTPFKNVPVSTCTLLVPKGSKAVYAAADTWKDFNITEFVDPIFSSPLNTQDEFNRWTVIDVNKDGKSWTYYASDKVARYYYSSTNQADDWLVSPAITVTKSGAYKLHFRYRGSSSIEAMDVWKGSDTTVASMTKCLVDLPYMNNSYLKGCDVLINANAAEPLRIAFHAKSPADCYKIYVDSVSLTECGPYDLGVDSITAPVSGMDLTDGTVTVKITNHGIADVTSVPVVYSVNGGTPVTETANQAIAIGKSISYTFATKADISTPGSYNIKAWTAYPGDELAANDSCLLKLRNSTAAKAPYYNSFEADSNVVDIAMYNLNHDDGNWSVGYSSFFTPDAHTGNKYMMYDYDRTNNANDWFVLQPIKLEPGYYSFKFWYSSLGDHNERMAVYYGNTSQDPATLTKKLVEYSPFNTNYYEESATVLKVDTAKVYYFGFKAFSDANENVIMVDDVSITPINPNTVDVAVTDLTNPESYIRSQSTKAIVYTVVNKAISDVTGATINVTLDGNSVYTKSIDLKAQASFSDSIKNIVDKAALGSHTLIVNITKDGDQDLTNNADTCYFKVVGDPTKLWDFEDAKIPADFRLVKMDNGTINSSVSDIFTDPSGWAILDIVKHSQFGEHMLGVTSYLDGVSTASRWCILPKIHVSGPDAQLIWTAASAQSDYPETYKVLITGDTTSIWNFNDVLEVKNESVLSRTHGIELGDSAGRDVYLAFRLITRGGNFLAMDNIGLYGDCNLASSTGVNQVLGDNAFRIALRSNHIVAINADARTITIYDMAGRAVLAAKDSNSLSVAGLAPGLYIAKALSKVGDSTIKFSIR